jgi:hypothetical protein
MLAHPFTLRVPALVFVLCWSTLTLGVAAGAGAQTHAEVADAHAEIGAISNDVRADLLAEADGGVDGALTRGYVGVVMPIVKTAVGAAQFGLSAGWQYRDAIDPWMVSWAGQAGIFAGLGVFSYRELKMAYRVVGRIA